MVDKLTQLPIIVITTHCHWDHIGGHSHFEDIAIHKFEEKTMEKGIPLPLELIKNQHVLRHPFTKNPPAYFDAEKYQPFVGKPTMVLNDLDVINLGNRNLIAIHTPGHSPGHICVYEKKTGYLITGDLLYKGDLLANFPTSNPVEFEQSLTRLTEIPYNFLKILPGHNDLNIPISYLVKTQKAFEELKKASKLKHGTGVHRFPHINIKL